MDIIYFNIKSFVSCEIIYEMIGSNYVRFCVVLYKIFESKNKK